MPDTEPEPNEIKHIHPLSSSQERRLVEYLEEQFLELTRGYKKRAEPTTHLPTLSSYLDAAQKLLSIILQIPPVDPSTSLRIAFLLRLTNDVLNCIPGYPPEESVLLELLDWLGDLDQAWVTILQSQIWDPKVGESVDLIIDANEAAAGLLRSTPMNQTERTRLRSLLLGAVASLEEWLGGMDFGVVGAADLEVALERLGLEGRFDELFSRTLQELGALGGTVVDPAGMMGTC